MDFWWTRPMQGGVVRVLVVVLMAAMAVQIVAAIHGQSLTWDEGDHIFAGYEGWKTHDFGLNPEHPPMVKMWATLPLLRLDLKVPKLQGRFFKTESYMNGRELLFRNGPANGGRYAGQSLVFACASWRCCLRSRGLCSCFWQAARCLESRPD